MKLFIIILLVYLIRALISLFVAMIDSIWGDIYNNYFKFLLFWPFVKGEK